MEDTVSGFLVEEGDVNALAQSLARFIAGPAQRKPMGAAGRRIVARDFDVGVLTERLVAHYEDLIAARARSAETQKDKTLAR